jgi:hypothetical protein
LIDCVGRLRGRQVSDDLLIFAGLKCVAAALCKTDHSSDGGAPLLWCFGSLVDPIETMATPAPLVHDGSSHFQIRRGH